MEHDTPKTLHQIRKIPISQAIRQRLDILLKRSSGALVVTSKTGTIFRPSTFLKDVWTKTAKASGITDKVPYSMRHSFAAWSLTLRIDPNRLVRLMGHGTKKMIYEVYGEGLKRIYGRFWSISAGTSWSRRERILPWSSITRKAIPCWFRPFLPSSPLKTEAPHSH